MKILKIVVCALVMMVIVSALIVAIVSMLGWPEWTAWIFNAVAGWYIGSWVGRRI